MVGNGRILALSVMVLEACQSTPRPAATGRDSAAGSVVALTPTAFTAVCDSVAGLWRGTGRATVRLTDTTTRIGPYWDERQQRLVSSDIHGCAAVATAPEGLDSAQHAGLYWKGSGARGWELLQDRDADGPDGNTRTRQRGDVQCQVDQAYDGGDDSDSTYVASPRLRQRYAGGWSRSVPSSACAA